MSSRSRSWWTTPSSSVPSAPTPRRTRRRYGEPSTGTVETLQREAPLHEQRPAMLSAHLCGILEADRRGSAPTYPSDLCPTPPLIGVCRSLATRRALRPARGRRPECPEPRGPRPSEAPPLGFQARSDGLLGCYPNKFAFPGRCGRWYEPKHYGSSPPLRSLTRASGRNHKETWAGCIVSLTTPTRSSLKASRFVSFLSFAEKASSVFASVVSTTEETPSFEGLSMRRRRGLKRVAMTRVETTTASCGCSSWPVSARKVVWVAATTPK
jgi:hypothetical protein